MTRLIRGEKDSNAKGTSCKTGSFSNLFFYPRGFNETDINSDEATPVPIPNTAVKLTSADNTCLETDREDRSTPTQKSLS